MTVEDHERYVRAAHAMQSGVRLRMSQEGAPDDHNLVQGHASPKHLRVGVNSAMVDQKAVVTLLIAKGVITEDEYVTAIAEAMEDEVQSYKELCGLREQDNFA